MRLRTIYNPAQKRVSLKLRRFPWWILLFLLIPIIIYLITLIPPINPHLPALPKLRQDSSSEDIDLEERLEEVDASKGDITISLGWNNKNDLDLMVVTPCKDTISYFYLKEIVCDGLMEFDRNADPERLTKRPFEHVVWKDGKAKEGKYKVLVSYYGNYDDEVKTEFEIKITIDDNSTTYHGVLNNESDFKIVKEFSYTK